MSALRRPSKLEWALIIVNAGFAGIFAFELANALPASPCWPTATPDCYPWGGEGPVAGDWRYATKVRYLLSMATLAVAPLTAVTLPFWQQRRGFNLTVLILALPVMTALQWLYVSIMRG